MACGEGYGSDVLARRAARGRRRRRQPRGLRARAAAVPPAGPAVRARPGRDVRRAVRRRRLPPDDRARPEPRRGPRALQAHLRRRRASSSSRRPNVLTLAPEGAEKSRQPVARQGVPPGGVPRRSARRTSRASRSSASSTRASSPGTQFAIERLGWDTIHAKLRITKPFYDRFTPAIATSDFALTADRPTRRRAGLRRRLPAVTPGGAREGRLAIVLHTPHALRRGLRDVAVRRGVAVGGRGDELPPAARAPRGRGARHAVGHAGPGRPARAPGVHERLLAFLRDMRVTTHELDAQGCRETGRPDLAAEVERAAGDYRWAAQRLEALGDGGLAAALHRHAAWTSSATHAVLPLLATDAGVRLQLRAGIDAHRERAGALARRAVAARVRARAVARRAARAGRRPRDVRRPHRRPRHGRPGAPAPGRAPGPGRCSCRSTVRCSSCRGATAAIRPAPRTATRTTSPSTTTSPGPTTGRSTTATAPSSRPTRTRATSSSASRERVAWRRAVGLRPGHRAARRLVVRGPAVAALRARGGRAPGPGRRAPRRRAGRLRSRARVRRPRARHDVGQPPRPLDVERPAGGRPGALGPGRGAARPRRRRSAPTRARSASCWRCRAATGPSWPRATPRAPTRGSAPPATARRSTPRWRRPASTTPGSAAWRRTPPPRCCSSRRAARVRLRGQSPQSHVRLGVCPLSLT